MSQTAYCLNLIKAVCELKRIWGVHRTICAVFIFIGKDQTITLSMSEIEGHIDFSSLEVSYDLMQKFYKVFTVQETIMIESYH